MQTDWAKIQSQTIDWLRFPMAVAVVMLHHGVTLIPTATDPLRSVCILFEEGICRLAVPCFFFISGYLFFSKLQDWNWDIWKTKIKRRVHSLLIPYILWNIIAFLAFWAYGYSQGNGLAFHQQFLKYGGIRMFWGIDGGLPLGIRSSPIDGPLWFIRDLMYYTIATPLVYCFIRWTRVYGLLALGLVFLFIPGIVPEGFMFFVTGAWLQLNQKNIVQLLWPRRNLLFLLATALLAATYAFYSLDYWGRFAKALFLFIGIGASFCGIAQLLDRSSIQVRPFLAQSSFFIFTTHEILILHQFAQPLVRVCLPSHGQFWPCVEFFLTPAVAIVICLGLLFLLQKALPRTTAILTGDRQVSTKH